MCVDGGVVPKSRRSEVASKSIASRGREMKIASRSFLRDVFATTAPSAEIPVLYYLYALAI